MPQQLYQLIESQAQRTPAAPALQLKETSFNYQELWQHVGAVASGLNRLGLQPHQRVAIYLPKTPQAVFGYFGTSAAGGVFVPINPLLKAAQIEHILADCEVSVLITSSDRLQALSAVLNQSASVSHIICTGGEITDATKSELAHKTLLNWDEFAAIDAATASPSPTRTEDDVAAVLYTSGSTGKPKGVVLSHCNMLSGAKSVASYLHNTADDRLLAVLPFSFDYGLSQLTTAFYAGASVVLMDYLLPRDVIRAVVRYEITGLAAVPPLWNQLADLEWPTEAQQSLRYITNSGGAVPPALSDKLHHALPSTDIYLMYGLTEAFRSTYLPPAELHRRPTSIGKAIPNAQVLVLRPDGSVCDDNEAGELVHRGPLVAQGYWNSPEKTAERFKAFPPLQAGSTSDEIAVWSGDSVYRDEEGYLYFVSRTDEMIKTSGYRVSPAEVEDVLYESGLVNDAVALGLPHDNLGQAIAAVVTASSTLVDKTTESASKIEALKTEIKRHCQQRMPNYMIPAAIIVIDELPKNPNGKYDRANLCQQFLNTFTPNIDREDGARAS